MFKNIADYIRELYGTQNFIPLHAPVFNGNEKKYLNSCIDSTLVSSIGEFVGRFEQMIAEYTGSKYAVAVVNGTSALHIALLLCNVKPDEEVITQPLSFIATSNAISYTGALPIFIDVDIDTLGLSPEKLDFFLKHETKIINKICYNKNTNKKISACIPMHTFGHPCRIEYIKLICDRYNIPVIEDAAESIGSFYKEKHTGTFGKFGVLSFNGNKTITTGGGGMLLTDDPNLAIKAKHITTTAKVSHPWEYIHDEIGYNYRLTNLAAAIGCAQMEQIDTIIFKKRELAQKYNDFFKNTKLTFIIEPENCSSNYWLNSILCSNYKELRNMLNYFNNNGIMTRPVWKLTNKLPMYKNCQTGDLSNSNWLEKRLINIPSSVIK